jgi:hypothetical protein
LITGFIGLFDTVRDYTLKVTVTPLLGSGFQRRAFRSSGFLNYSRSQLPASNSNSSQRLNPSSPLTDYNSKPKSKLCYDRRSVGQSVLVSSLHLGPKTRFYYCQRVAGLLMWAALSEERTICPLQLLLALASPVILQSEFRGTHGHILLSDSRLSLPGGPEPHIYMYASPRNRVAQFIPGTGFPLRRLLRLAFEPASTWREDNCQLVLLITRTA